jgi:hypothetical protein
MKTGDVTKLSAGGVALACVLLWWWASSGSAPPPKLAWESTGGPSGGYIADTAVGSEGEAYAAAGSAGLFMSLDSGATWSHVSGPAGAPSLTRVAVSGGTVCVTDGRSLYRSSDLNTWKTVSSESLGERCWWVEVPLLRLGMTWLGRALRPGSYQASGCRHL